MSAMAESLLLHAQKLVSTGECSASIDTLRVVISQCTSDINNCEEGGEVDVDENACRTSRRMRNVASHLLSTLLLQRAGRRKLERCITVERRRRTAQDIGEYDDNCRNDRDEDECEADALLHTQLGYQLRLSTMAFGYPPCGCSSSSCSKFKSSPSPVLNSSSATFQRTTIIDDVLSPLLLQKLKLAFRPKSTYWSEFYRHYETNIFASHNIPLPPTSTSYDSSASSSSSSSSLLDQQLHQSKSLFKQVAIIIQQNLIHHFPDIIHATSAEIWCHARSHDEGHRLHYDMDEILLWLERSRKQQQQQQQQQQTQQSWKRKEKEVEEEQSVRRRVTSKSCKYNCVSRSIDGTPSVNETIGVGEQSRKRRPKIHLPPPSTINEVAGQITTTAPASGESPSSSLLLVKSNQLVENEDTENDTDGISCPIVSCVLTLSVPNNTICPTCGELLNCAPTIICDQSISQQINRPSCCTTTTTTMSSNDVGYLCFPKINRLLAFDGSLLHGVMPGIPTLQCQSSSSSSMSSDGDDDDDDDDNNYDHNDDGKSYDMDDNDNVNKQRITMMLGFWKNVCTTKSTIIGDNEKVSSIVGPNVPYATPAGSWKEDFKPISISKYDLAGMMKSCNVMSEKSSSDLVVIDPLWIPIHSGSTKQEEEEKKMNNYVIDEYSLCNNGSSICRYFLKSCSPCEIDKEILSGF